MFDTGVQRLRRHYGHFHRVLGALLTRLVVEGRAYWLTDKAGHILSPTGEDNLYQKAIYTLSDLSSVHGELDELAGVQTQALGLMGRNKPTPSLLLPLVVEEVDSIRLNAYTAMISEPLSKAQALKRMDKLITHQQANLDAFRRYQTLHDPRLEKVASELQALKEAKARISASQEDAFRFRTAQPITRAYTYRLDGSVTSPYVIDHGMFAVGPNVTIAPNTSRRKGRSDKVSASTLYEDSYVKIYEENVWQRAKEVSKKLG
jgi:hypothetical protein